MRILIIITAAIFACIFLYAANFAVINYLGYCSKDFSYISDEHKIEGALDLFIHRVAVEDRTGILHPPTMSDDDYHQMVLRHFHDLNPDCCHIVAGGQFIQKNFFLDRITGFGNTFVSINYIPETIGLNSHPYLPKIMKLVRVSNCGRYSNDY